MSKLTEDDVRLVRSLRSQGLMYKEIARQMGINKTTVWRILNGRVAGSWGWVK